MLSSQTLGKTNGAIKKDNPETLEIMGTQDKGRGQTQQKTQDKTRQKMYHMNNADHTKMLGGMVKKSLKILKE